MNADYPCKEETDNIIGCAFAVLNDIGHGYHEKPYENSMVVEFEYRGIPYLQQPRYPIMYRDKQVAEYIPDLIAFGKVIIDTKVIERITDHEIGQMLNYLKTRSPSGHRLDPKFHPPQAGLTQVFIHVHLRPSAVGISSLQNHENTPLQRTPRIPHRRNRHLDRLGEFRA
jgi:GxxExxY protein